MRKKKDAAGDRAARWLMGPTKGIRPFAWAALAAAVLASGCSLRSGLSPREDLLAGTVGSVGHYGSGIIVTDFSIDGFRGGRVEGWGGGGGGMCCVLIPKKLSNGPLVVTVKWETYRQKVKEKRQHEATVPVHFDVPPDQGGALFVHFLPGHQVALWVSDPKQIVPYTGPADPIGPAPLYQPLPDEKPWPPGTTAYDVRTKMVGELDE